LSHKPRKNGTDGLGGGSLDYPNDVAVSTDTLPYLVIVGKPYEYGLKKVYESFTGPPPSQANTFRLLLPSAIATNDSLTYESFSSLAGSAIENLAQGNLSEAGGDALNAAMEKIKGEVGLADKYAGIKGIMAGKVVKTKEQLLFKSPTLRSHSFTFNMFPRNTKDAKNIATIIYSLKTLAYPTTVSALDGRDGEGGLGDKSNFVFPYTFSVNMVDGARSGIENGFPKIDEAFITSITTNLSGHGGRMGLNPDGSFQNVELSLTFQDRRLKDDSNIV
jgi:hypothetical protein